MSAKECCSKGLNSREQKQLFPEHKLFLLIRGNTYFEMVDINHVVHGGIAVTKMYYSIVLMTKARIKFFHLCLEPK